MEPNKIAISSGDLNGIGLEVIIKTLHRFEDHNITPVILSSVEVIEFYHDQLDINISYNSAKEAGDLKEGVINVLESYGNENSFEIEPGELSRTSGRLAMKSVEKGIELCTAGQADALVTAPISKEAVNLAGYHIPGHTEFLAKKTETSDFMMMLVNDALRVGLVSIHIPLAEVPSKITEQSVSRNIKIMSRALTRDFSLPEPTIAVLGLNPHAGDGGVIGNEEIDIIAPALQKLKNEQISVEGPFPADGFFGNRKYENFDGILAMYHDQGLIPFKSLSFGEGVNFTAGLPIVRTSPDHGTAFDIAGKGVANPSSFNEAFKLAQRLASNRKEQNSS